MMDFRRGLAVLLRAAALLALATGPLIGQPLARGADEDRASEGAEQAQGLARVGSEVITADQFLEEMRRRSAGDSTRFDEPAERRALLDAMLQRAAVIDLARSEGYLDRPEIKAAVDRVLFTRYLQDQLDARLDALPPVTAADLEAHYAQKADQYSRPARSQVAVVFLAVSSKAPQAIRDQRLGEAEMLLEEAKEAAAETPHFGDLARRVSDDRSSRYRGGVIGWLTDHQNLRYKWDPAVVEAAFAIDDVGGFAPIVQTDEGFYLVRLVQREEAQRRPLDSLASGIRRQLENQRRDEERERFYEEVLSSRSQVIDDELFQQLAAPELLPVQNGSEPNPGTPE